MRRTRAVYTVLVTCGAGIQIRHSAAGRQRTFALLACARQAAGGLERVACFCAVMPTTGSPPDGQAGQEQREMRRDTLARPAPDYELDFGRGLTGGHWRDMGLAGWDPSWRVRSIVALSNHA